MTDRSISNGLVMVRDAIAVLAGILIAFGLDAWWGHVQNTRAADEAVSHVLAEFEYNAPVLRRIIEGNEGQDAATKALQTLGPAGVRSIEPDSLRTLIKRSTSAGTFDPSVGATNAAIASGVLRESGMNRLARELEAWQAALEDVREEAGVQIQAFYDFHQANVAAGTLSSLIAIREDGDEEAIPQVAEALTKPGLLREQHANMAMSVRWNTAELRRIETQLGQVLAAIAELRPPTTGR